jgi:two-component system, OmpR family, phosphate regulon response regulator OmpR
LNPIILTLSINKIGDRLSGEQITGRRHSMKTILVVDDNDRIRSIYRKKLSQEGYRVLESSSADEANDLLLIYKVDMLLLDINMPSVDGVVFHMVTEMFHPDIKVIVASVYPIDNQKLLIKDADDYFDKSEGLKVLVNKVKSLLMAN